MPKKDLEKITDSPRNREIEKNFRDKVIFRQKARKSFSVPRKLRIGAPSITKPSILRLHPQEKVTRGTNTYSSSCTNTSTDDKNSSTESDVFLESAATNTEREENSFANDTGTSKELSTDDGEWETDVSVEQMRSSEFLGSEEYAIASPVQFKDNELGESDFIISSKVPTTKGFDLYIDSDQHSKQNFDDEYVEQNSSDGYVEAIYDDECFEQNLNDECVERTFNDVCVEQNVEAEYVEQNFVDECADQKAQQDVYILNGWQNSNQGIRKSEDEIKNSVKDIFDFPSEDSSEDRNIQFNTHKKKRKLYRSGGIKRCSRGNRPKKAYYSLSISKNSTGLDVSEHVQNSQNKAENLQWPMCCLTTIEKLKVSILEPVIRDDLPIDSITLMSLGKDSKKKCNH